MKKVIVLITVLLFVNTVYSQQTEEAKKLLDEVSTTMSAYKNMQLAFSTSLVNEDVGINENDETPILGKITLQGEKYKLDYLGNTFIYDGEKLYVINHDDDEITINDQDISEEDEGFIYPSKLLTFYQEGYNYSLSDLKTINNQKIQFIELIPIDSSSEIVTVRLGINIRTKHIYQLIQIGENSTKTTLTINQFKSNQVLPDHFFLFDRKTYEQQGYLID